MNLSWAISIGWEFDFEYEMWILVMVFISNSEMMLENIRF